MTMMITLRNAWWVTRFRRPVVAGYLSRLSWEAPDGRQAWPTRFSRPRFDLGGARAELIETFDNFTFDEVLRYRNLDARIRRITQLASKIASQAVRENRVMLGAALNAGVTLVEAKEVVYQAVPYVGMAKVFDFIHATKDVLTARGVILPLPGQSTTTPENRAENPPGNAEPLVVQAGRADTGLLQLRHGKGQQPDKGGPARQGLGHAG